MLKTVVERTTDRMLFSRRGSIRSMLMCFYYTVCREEVRQRSVWPAGRVAQQQYVQVVFFGKALQSRKTSVQVPGAGSKRIMLLDKPCHDYACVHGTAKYSDEIYRQIDDDDGCMSQIARQATRHRLHYSFDIVSFSCT